MRQQLIGLGLPGIDGDRGFGGFYGPPYLGVPVQLKRYIKPRRARVVGHGRRLFKRRIGSVYIAGPQPLFTCHKPVIALNFAHPRIPGETVSEPVGHLNFGSYRDGLLTLGSEVVDQARRRKVPVGKGRLARHQIIHLTALL